MMFLNTFLVGWLFVIHLFQLSTSLWVDRKGGYRDLLIAVDSSTQFTDCQDLFHKIEALSTLLSQSLFLSTRRRVHVTSVDVILGTDVARRCDVTSVASGQKWTSADIRVTQGNAHIRPDTWRPHGPETVTVPQPSGCSHPGDALYVDASLLSLLLIPHSRPAMQGEGTRNRTERGKGEGQEEGVGATMEEMEEIRREIGQVLVTSWGRYRWGVFEGLPVLGGDAPHDPEEGVPYNERCGSNNSKCRQLPTEPSKLSQATNYNSTQFDKLDSPEKWQGSPQQLICGEPAWSTVQNHPDFASKSGVKRHFQRVVPSTKRSVSFISDATPKPSSDAGDSDARNNNTPHSTASTVVKNSTTQNNSQENTDDSQVPAKYGVKERNTRAAQFYKENDSKNTGSNSKIGRNNSKNTKNNSKIGRNDSKMVKSNFKLNAPSSTVPAFIGTLPPAQKNQNGTSGAGVVENPTKPSLLLHPFGSQSYSPSSSRTDETSTSVSWITSTNPTSTTNLSQSNHSVTWIRTKLQNKNGYNKFEPKSGLKFYKDLEGFQPPKITYMSSPGKAIVVALDLSRTSVAQVSVEWLRGGLLRWMFGVGSEVNVGILASYSNTSFPLSLGPLSPGPTTARQLEEHMTLLPYQHEVDDDVYGGVYCIGCVISETEKMLTDSGIPLKAGVLVLPVCEPHFSITQMRAALKTPISIHTITICPNAPFTVERLSENQESWALSQVSMESGFTAEVQLAKLLAKITEETVLWPHDGRMSTVYEEDTLLGENDVEKAGAYRRVSRTITIEKGKSSRLIILASSSPAKIVELTVDSTRIPLTRDTTRRYWALLKPDQTTITYTLKYLSTSLDLPLTLSIGIYERTKDRGIEVKIRTSTRHYQPMYPSHPYLKVWAEVAQNGNVIKDADVTLSVTYLSGRTPSTYSLMLLDDGSTEPDMLPGDGIYSRYLTWTPGHGRYILTASASGSSHSVSQEIIDGELKVSKTGRFSALSSSISLIVEMVIPGDIFPPSRVTNLAVAPTEESRVNISWTAPGGDLDQGSAWRYQLKMYTESAALNEANFDSSGIDVYCIQGEEQAPTPSPALFGTPQFCVTSIPFANLNWYFAIRAIDGANNTGRISNIVSAYVSEPTTTLSPTQNEFKEDIQKVMMSTIVPSENSVKEAETDSWRLYGAALLGAVGFVMLAISLFACILCCRRARIRASKDPERPIYKIYVNNAYIQEEDGEIKVVSKEKSLNEKDSTEWVNSLDKYSSADVPREGQADISADTGDSSNPSSSKFPKPIRFGVLTNGSIMRELPISSSSSSSSKPSDETTGDDFKYKDLSETISNSTTDGATASTSSAGTEISTTEPLTSKDPPRPTFQDTHNLSFGYDVSYPPLGIPTLPGPAVIPIHSNRKLPSDYHSDDEGGFRPRFVPGPGTRRHAPPPHFSSFRYIPTPGQQANYEPRPIEHQSPFIAMAKVTSTLPHGTVRSVKKRRHISFV